jgi:transposase InsO family protein
MAPVAEAQTQIHEPPFSSVGLDFFGPFYVKRGRGVVKRYGCIFTCLTTRAVHLEVAHSLDTNSLLAAISRFIARRGSPKTLHSDRGTNMTSADKELRGSLEWSDDAVTAALSPRRIEW